MPARPAPDPPAAVVFDCDGLLLDTENAWSRAEVVLYRRHGATFTLAHKQELLGTGGPVAARTMERHLRRPGAGPALLAELHDLVLVEIARSAPARPGAVELLAALRARGTPVGVASNSPPEVLGLALRTAGLADAFDAALSAVEAGALKPAPDVYLEACRRLGAAPGAALALEDSPTGVAAARAAGLFVVGVPSLEGVGLEEADLVAASLAAPEVHRAAGLRLVA